MAIIFFDIDGTLATGTAVPPSAAEAIARTRAAGNLVFICTGRPRGYAESTFGAYADGFVCCNGRLAVRGGERVIDRPVPPTQIAAIRNVLEGLGVGYAFFSENALHYGGNPAYRHVCEEVHDTVGTLADASDSLAGFYSFDVFFAEAREREAIATALANTCLVNPHGPHPSADVTILGYGKGDAVRDVTRALGIEPDESYAFGDGVNDISMLQEAGHGVAMGNAVPELKAVADYVTTSIGENGVANGLAHFGLA